MIEPPDKWPPKEQMDEETRAARSAAEEAQERDRRIAQARAALYMVKSFLEKIAVFMVFVFGILMIIWLVVVCTGLGWKLLVWSWS
jgi:uncharacterized membrane protein